MLAAMQYSQSTGQPLDEVLAILSSSSVQNDAKSA